MVKSIETAADIPKVGKVVLDFYAKWCGPCKVISPKFEALSQINPSWTFLKVDVELAIDLSEEFNIEALPTFVFLVDGVERMRIAGASLERIEEALDSLN